MRSHENYCSFFKVYDEVDAYPLLLPHHSLRSRLTRWVPPQPYLYHVFRLVRSNPSNSVSAETANMEKIIIVKPLQWATNFQLKRSSSNNLSYYTPHMMLVSIANMYYDPTNWEYTRRWTPDDNITCDGFFWDQLNKYRYFAYLLFI